MTPLKFSGRLIIISNRLPVCFKCTGDGTYDASPSSGGLVTGLSGLAKSGMEYRWYGWPGIEVLQKYISHVRDDLLQNHDAVPVLLDQHTAERYYDGFSSTHMTCLRVHRGHKLIVMQIPPFGRCSTTTSTRCCSMKIRKPHIAKRTRCLRIPLRPI